ncbi:Alpha/Beta hydrolase protein [Aspergillus multicolor]|uniref:alpha/beta hydrolase n=1 Tax=Aspergillus multicolor TaxID=41759 RepID=UPI003CCD5CDE
MLIKPSSLLAINPSSRRQQQSQIQSAHKLCLIHYRHEDVNMPLTYDPEFLSAVGPLLSARAAAAKPAPHDIPALRTILAAALEVPAAAAPAHPDIEETHFSGPSYDGHMVDIYRVARKPLSNTEPAIGPAIVHAHGGGLIFGSAKQLTRLHHHAIVAETDVPVYTVEYRLAPEHVFPAGVEDVYAALKWVQEQGEAIGVDCARIGIQGESAGGNLAAAVALMARDRGLSPPLAKQILVYPMLYDRTVLEDDEKDPHGSMRIWSFTNNLTGWSAYLGGRENVGLATTSKYAVPAREIDLRGLPSTYIDVGGLDIFRDENVKYAVGLAAADVDVEFHLYPGIPHLWDGVAPGIEVSKRALANRKAAILSF